MGSNFYGWTNLTPYVTSYIRANGYPDTSYSEMSWAASLVGSVAGIAMWIISPILARHFSSTWAVFLGGLSMPLATLSCYWLLDYGPLPVILIYGIGSGLASAMYTIPICNLMRWLPNNNGLGAGICVGSYAAGAAPFDLFASWYVNPDNVQPVNQGGDMFFVDPKLLARVPHLMAIIAIIYLVILILASALICDPRSELQEQLESLLLRNADIESEEGMINPTSATESTKSGSHGGYAEERSERMSKTTMKVSAPSIAYFRERTYWILWSTFFFTGASVLFVVDWIKVFGQNRGFGDFELARAMGIASILNGVSRILWGMAVDRIKFVVCCGICTAGSGFCVFLLNFCDTATSFTVVTCCLFCFYAASFAIMPTAIAQVFGTENLTRIYGGLYMGPAVGLIIGSTMTQAMQKNGHLSTVGLSYVVSALCFAAFAINLLHYTEDTKLIK